METDSFSERILLICGCFVLGQNAAAERAFALTRYFIRQGYQVDILTLEADPEAVWVHYPEWRSVVRVWVSAAPRNFWWCNRWLRFVAGFLFFFPDEFSIRASRMIDFCKQNLVRNNYLWCYVTTPPHSLQIVGDWIHRRYHIPFICDLRDPWGENKRIHYRTPLHRMISAFWYRRVIRDCFRAIINTEHGLQLFRRSHGVGTQSKAVLIPNGYDEDAFVRQTANPSSGAPLRIVYCGGRYGGRVEFLLQKIAAELQRTGVSFRIEIFGMTGTDADGICFHGCVPPDQLPGQLFRAHILFLYMPETVGSTPAFSLKAYGYARSGRPVAYMGPKNITYEFLQRNTQVQHFDCDDASGCARWMSVHAGDSGWNGNHMPEELLQCDWERRFRVLDQILMKRSEFEKNQTVQ